MKTATEKQAHTPGPWRMRIPSQYSTAQVKSEYDLQPVADVYGAERETRRANASLIAAAPEMLEALEDMVGYFKCSTHHFCVLRRVEAAIQKARGGAMNDRCEIEHPLGATGENSMRCNAPHAELCLCGAKVCYRRRESHLLHDCPESLKGETIANLLRIVERVQA